MLSLSRQLVHHQRVSAALLKLRTAANLTSRVLAERINISQSKVSRVERGKALPTAEEVTAWAQATGADPDTLSELLAELDAALTEFATWQVALRDGLAGHQEQIRELETTAAVVHSYQMAVIPGLLQTAEYARRVFQLADPGSDQDYASAVARRLDRQQALYDETRQFEFLLTEHALRVRVGPASLVAPQLDRIAQISTLSNVTIGVIPSTALATTMVMHAFILFEPFDDEEGSFVVVELVHGEVFVSDPQGLKLYHDRLNRLRQMAVFGDDARALFTAIAREQRPAT